jgi:hypothetical protein
LSLITRYSLLNDQRATDNGQPPNSKKSLSHAMSYGKA